MRRLPATLRPVLLLSFLMCCLVLRAQDGPETVRLHWQPGTLYTQETTTETTTVLTAIGQPQDQKMKVRQTTVIDVTAVSSGEVHARVTFTALAGEMQHEGQTYAYDSKNPAVAHSLLRQTLGDSVGKSFVLVYGQDDGFKGVKDTAGMVEAEDGQPPLQSLAQANEVAELYRRSLEMGLPKVAKVRPGDRWSSKEVVDFPRAGTVNVDLRGHFETLVDYEGRRHAKISFEGDLHQVQETNADGTPRVSDRRVSIGAGSKTFGQILFDLERRTVSFSAFRADIAMEVDGRKIPVRQQVTTKLVEMRAKG